MIIDFHTHIFPPFVRENRVAFFPDEPAFQTIYHLPRSRLAGVSELISDLDEEGVHKAVVFGFPWEKEDNYRRHNDYIVESVSRYPDRLIGLCCFSVRSPHGVKEAERCLQMGLKGVGELAVYDSGLDRDIINSFQDIMAVCRKSDAPVLLHVNEPVGHLYPGKAPISLAGIYQFIQAYPENKIVLAHWGGGIFFYELMKKEVKALLKNTWFDTAASPYLYVPDIYKIACTIVGEGRILFGSDYPLLKPQRYFKEMRSAGIGPDAFKRIAGLNAAELLNLSGSGTLTPL